MRASSRQHVDQPQLSKWQHFQNGRSLLFTGEASSKEAADYKVKVQQMRSREQGLLKVIEVSGSGNKTMRGNEQKKNAR